MTIRGKAKLTTATKQTVECAECGVLMLAAAEGEAFTLAYKHAATNAHIVTVRSVVETTISGYIDDWYSHE